MEDQYRDFAEDYSWIRPLEFLSGEALLDRYSSLLERGGKNARILDCACGVGTDAIALAQAGFSVWASDGSEAMVATAKERAREAGVSLPIAEVPWDMLTSAYDQPFDLVFCTGNAIVHTGGEEPMIAALANMRAIMKRGATLVVDSRNWDKQLVERPANQALPPAQLGSTRCLPVYLWDYGETFEGPHGVTIVLLFERNGSVTVRRHDLTFTGFRRDDLIRRLEAVGLRDMETEWSSDESWYSVTARSP